MLPGALPPEPAGPPASQSVQLLAPTPLRTAPGGPVVARLKTKTEFGTTRFLLVVAERGEWLGVLAPELPNGTVGWISGRQDVLVFPGDWRVDVSLARRRAVVRSAGRPVLAFPVATGTTTTPTPIGRFAVTDRLRFGAGSPYGCCALALSGHQPFLPQGWGAGDRIAFHGTPDEASVGSAASHGCLRARAADVRQLTFLVPLGTPVFIRP